LRSVLCLAFLLFGVVVVPSGELAGEEPFGVVLPTHPVRHLELVSGERLLVENVRGDDGGLTFRWNGSTRCRLPLAMIRSVANPPGWIDRLDESFEAAGNATSRVYSGHGAWNSATSSRWEHRCEPALAAGELAFWKRTDSTEDQKAAVSLRLTFDSDGVTTELVLMLDDPEGLSVALPDGWRRTFSQRLRVNEDWSRVVIHWREQRCEIQVNHAVHSVFTAPAMKLRRVALEPAKTSTVIVDDLVLREYRPELAAMPVPPQVTESVDTVTLGTGDQLFGEFAAGEVPSTIKLLGEQLTWTGDWSEVSRVDFARRPMPPQALAPVRGWFCDFRAPRSTEFTPFVRNLRLKERTAYHPWLGTVPRPSLCTADVRFGEFRWLEPDRRHLGDEIRAALSPTIPVGTSISGTMDFASSPRGPTWIMVDVAEMEPSGPDTPPMQPFLTTLRGGGLRTELVINDRVVTDLNRFLRARPRVTHPERVWLPVPTTAWRAGTNSWAIRQRPLSSTQPQYDDAEVGRIALWIAPF